MNDYKHVIWKFPLRLAEQQYIQMPYLAKILSVQMQANNLVMWAVCDQNKETKTRLIEIHGTGNPIDRIILGEHIGTVQLDGFVWHFFDQGYRTEFKP